MITRCKNNDSQNNVWYNKEIDKVTGRDLIEERN